MNLRLYLGLLLFPIFTGATFNLAAYAVHSFSPSGAAAWRFGIAAVVMLALLAMREKGNFGALRRNAGLFLLLGIVGVFGFNLLFFVGMKHTSPVNGSLIMATNPLVTTVLAALLLHEKITFRQWAGMLGSLAGVLLVITHGSWEIMRTLSLNSGDLAVLGGNLCWALYGVLGKRFIRASTNLANTTYTMVVGALGLIAVSVADPNPVALSEIPAGAWGAILFMAVCTSVIGYLVWNRGIAELGASRTSLFFNLVPVVTMIISACTGQTLTSVQLLGALLVIGGVLTATGAWKMFRPAGNILPYHK
jgi:drug/metabolite transporter (DMT)-like permease